MLRSGTADRGRTVPGEPAGKAAPCLGGGAAARRHRYQVLLKVLLLPGLGPPPAPLSVENTTCRAVFLGLLSQTDG